MDIKSKAVRGFAWTISQRVGTHAVSFLVFLTLSRFLGAEDFGLVSMATALVVFADNIIDLGFTQALIQREKIDKDHIDSAFWTVIILGCGLTLMGILGSSTIAVIYNEPRVAKVLAWISISIMFSALGKIQWGILQRSLAFDKLAIRTFISELIGGVVGIMMALQGYGVWSLVGRNLSRDFTGMLVIWKMSNWRPGFRFSIKHFKHLFPFGANIIGNRLMEYSNRYVDQLFIGSILGAAALGYYTVGLRLYQLMLSLFLQSVSSVSFPVFSRLQEDFERLKRSFYQVTKFACLISFPIFIGMALVTPNIILTFFGQKWVPSIPVMQLFSLLGIVEVINYLGSSLLVATGKVTWKLGLTSINALINAIAILITVHTGIIAVTTAQV
ncbi:MAG: lipopolysaccharide biosynthesis protein, partial [Anaerolineales bacterium]